MPIAVTVRPIDASASLLPVGSDVELFDGPRSLGTARCPPGNQVRFAALADHRVYRILLSADGFQSSGAVVSAAAADLTVDVPCRLHASECRPDVPPLESLDAELLRVLAADADDAAPVREVRAQDLPTRTLPHAAPPARSLPEPISHLDGRAAGRWADMRPEQRSGLLNLFAKMRSITVRDKPLWSYVERLIRVEQDRIFVDMAQVVATYVKELPLLFKDADDSLHTPDAGYERAGSVKSQEARGNLQLSFSVAKDGAGSMRVDADIDEAAGLGHAGQVLRNWLTGGKTHPYDVHQILVTHQRGPLEATRPIGAYRPCYRLGRRAGPANYRLPPTTHP